MSNSNRLRTTLAQLFEGQPDDARLRDHLEGLRRDEHLPGLTWYWGPILYQRNRAMFRPFILQHFSAWQRGWWSQQRVAWSDQAAPLESWLQAARTNRDVQLVRRLLRWKHAGKWGIDPVRWKAALWAAYRAADGPAARAVVLDEFDDWFDLDEDSALQLYRHDRACGPFLLKHLPQGFWSEHKRQLWTRLLEAAEQAGDDRLRFPLYRKQVPVKQWTQDVLELARSISSPDRLCDELLRRHPEGYGLDATGTLVQLLEHRGRDVLPYVRQKLPELFRFWGRVSQPFVKLAERRGWWDLWAAAIRADRDNGPFNRAVAGLLDDRQLPEAARLERLQALAGASREWNWPGLGLVWVHELKDALAARLYGRYPQLVHGPFKPHVTPMWWRGYPQLLRAAQAAGDEELVDLLASRYATRIRSSVGRQGEEIMATADALAEDYQQLRDRDPTEFARRAANVLTQIPAYAIGGYDQLLRTNQLARLLFVRSFDSFLAAPEAVRDLVEASDIHVQMLAYRVLARDDQRARQLAVETLEILIGTLWRPLHRKTRLAAFDALANAAAADPEAARLILRRSREALRLPDKKYPKEELVGLIGGILHRQPSLRGPREQPRVYGLEELAP